MDSQAPEINTPRKPLLTTTEVLRRRWTQDAMSTFLGAPDERKRGRGYYTTARVVAPESLPEIAEIRRREQRVSASTLKSRGWTDATIARFARGAWNHRKTPARDRGSV